MGVGSRGRSLTLKSGEGGRLPREWRGGIKYLGE